MKKKASRIISVLLAVAMSFIMCACGGANVKEELSVEELVEFSVQAKIGGLVKIMYDITGAPRITCYVEEVDENEYEVTGKVTVTDKYGDTYTGKYDAEVEYDPEKKSCLVGDCDIADLYKD